MTKTSFSERDICTKFITPAVTRAGWDSMTQVREEVSFTKGRIIVRGKLVTRGKGKRADYILYYKPNIPIAVIEAKDNDHAIGDGIQKGLEYAETLNIPSLPRTRLGGRFWNTFRALHKSALPPRPRRRGTSPTFTILGHPFTPTPCARGSTTGSWPRTRS